MKYAKLRHVVHVCRTRSEAIEKNARVFNSNFRCESTTGRHVLYGSRYSNLTVAIGFSIVCAGSFPVSETSRTLSIPSEKRRLPEHTPSSTDVPRGRAKTLYRVKFKSRMNAGWVVQFIGTPTGFVRTVLNKCSKYLTRFLTRFATCVVLSLVLNT